MELDIYRLVYAIVPGVELDIYRPVLVTVPSVELDIYHPVLVTVPSVGLDISDFFLKKRQFPFLIYFSYFKCF